jgi:hypothetical protein
MKKFPSLVALIALGLGSGGLITSAMGQPLTSSPILSATQHSGYTTPEQAFENHCDVSSLGAVTGYQSTEWNTTTNTWTNTQSISMQIADLDLTNLKANIAVAKTGSILNGPAVCDGGTVDISVRLISDSSSFVIVNALDCSPSHVNQSNAANDLRNWVSAQCKVNY